MDIFLNLADCLIQIHGPENCPTIFWPDAPWDQFECAANSFPDIYLEVTTVNRLPKISHDRLVFDSNHGSWKLFDAGQDFYFESLEPLHLTPFRRALISKDFSRARVWALTTHHQNQTGWTPAQVINPIAEICLLTWLARRGALMLHASGIVMESGAWIFSGPSGAGKTTIAEIFSKAAVNRLSDETILVRRSEQGFTAYGTPWCGEGRIAANVKAPLRYLFFIRHGKDQHTLFPASISNLSRDLFQQAFLPHWDVEAMEKTAGVVQEIAEQGISYQLAFLKSRSVVDFLMAHDHVPT